MIRLALVVLSILLTALAFGSIDVRTCVVVVSDGANPQETFAAHELRDYLSQITGVDVPLKTESEAPKSNFIVVGSGPLAHRLLPDAAWDKLGPEQTLVRATPRALVVAGGASRGTLYAVYRLLQVGCGVRWWAPWATTIPKNPALKFDAIDSSETPAFEYRDPYWAHSFDANWAARNFDNGANTHVDDAQGGKTIYAAGFVHTYNALVPPDKEFAVHPEWFSLINGVRTASNAQLCTTNPQLREFIVQRVREQLRANPKATIVSVSQNDCYNPCQCPVCRALAEKEGSDSALVLDLANYVADQIKDEFPNVAVDTLAYQWSRHPPRTMKPRPNVIVRLCSIECNFAEPLFAASNKAFSDDIEGWNKLTNRVYVWDYCTDFGNYLQPQPDYLALAPTLKWFADNGVKGVFEEGDYTSNGGDMAELKAWVIAQMLWNPKQDPDAVVNEFLQGYYGAAAAPIRDYLELMTSAAKGVHVSFGMGGDAPFLNYDVMSEARGLWEKAKQAVADSPVLEARVRMSALSSESVWLSHWAQFRYEASKKGDQWPLPPRREQASRAWMALATNPPLEGYAPIGAIDEGRMTPAAFIERLGPEPPVHEYHPLPARGKNPPPPPGLPEGVDFQDDLAKLWQAPFNSELRADPLASDGIACWMPGSHHQWAFQMSLGQKPVTGRFEIYAIVRLEATDEDGSDAFWAGVYDNASRRDLLNKKFALSGIPPGYQAYDLGAYDVTPDMTVWVSPPANPKVTAVWVDRIYLVPKE